MPIDGVLIERVMNSESTLKLKHWNLILINVRKKWLIIYFHYYLLFIINNLFIFIHLLFSWL